MNQIIIKGRLTKPPELKYVGDNKSVCNFDVAVNRRFGEETDFFNVQAWGKTGEFVNKFFIKGQEILIQGSMQCQPYEKNGTKFYPWRLIAEQVEFCGSKKDIEQSNANVPEGFQQVPLDDDDDIPF